MKGERVPVHVKAPKQKWILKRRPFSISDLLRGAIIAIIIIVLIILVKILIGMIMILVHAWLVWESVVDLENYLGLGLLHGELNAASDSKVMSSPWGIAGPR